MPLVDPKDLKVDDYITDGSRLLRIERVTTIGIDAENVRNPDGGLVSLPRTTITREWKKVEYVAADEKRPTKKKRPPKVAA